MAARFNKHQPFFFLNKEEITTPQKGTSLSNEISPPTQTNFISKER
jgi:hypothetical protein